MSCMFRMFNSNQATYFRDACTHVVSELLTFQGETNYVLYCSLKFSNEGYRNVSLEREFVHAHLFQITSKRRILNICSFLQWYNPSLHTMSSSQKCSYESLDLFRSVITQHGTILVMRSVDNFVTETAVSRH